MAAALAVGAIGPAIEVVKLVTNPIKRQFNYLCCFTSNINSLKVEAQNLGDAIAGLEGEVELARDNLQEPVPQVKTWLTKSKKIKDEINQIVSQAPNVESGCLKIGARFSLSKKAKKTTDRTKELQRENKFDVKIFLQGPPAARQKTELRKTYEFESRKEIEESIMTTLRGGDVNMMGIHGMGGLGKTTMARKLMNRALEENVCQEVVIATVSENVDISKIQDEIGGQLGLEKLKDEKSESARATLLRSRLSGTKRILLVLDDVWKTLELDDFGIPRDSKGCTILFTSRNRDALRDAQIFGMDALSEEEAWPFFKERAGTCVDDRELNPIAKQVAKECGGLPINLAAVSAGLRDKRNAAYWKDTLRDLKQSVPDNVKYGNKTYNSLKRSYDLLESEISKSIFLLCCLFPEDANIRVEYLTYFCTGLDIFEGITNMEDARNKMLVETEFLKNRSLLLDSDTEDCVRMHDVVRDVCTFIAKEKGYIGKDDCTWISSSHLVGQRNALLSGSRCPNLRLLYLEDSTYDGSLGFKFDNAYVEGMRELHVLCIRNYRSLTRLPHPTQSLGKLNTLILESCHELKSISVVGELVNLEILICRFCYSIEKLPSEMKGLNRLKLLELTLCENLRSIGRGIISCLVGLEELKMYRSFNGWEAEEREERENASIKELEALPNLACLEIDIEDSSVLTENMPLLSKKIVRFIIRINSQYIRSEFSKGMSLCLERESHLGDWIEMQLLRDTEYLYLRGDGANNMELAKGQNIRWMELYRCENMKNVVRTSGGSDDATVFFPSLEHLELYSLPELEEICDGPISSTSFQNLRELRLSDLRALTQIWKSTSVCENNNKVPHFSNLSSIQIWFCHSLRNLGQLSMADGKDCLPQLEQLEISNCSMMEQVFLWNDEEVITKVFPKLKEVKLYDLPNLTTFCQGIQRIEFPLLQNMKIKYCPKMKSIIKSCSSADIDDSLLLLICQPQEVSFGSLEVLMIDYIGSMGIFTLSTAANLVNLRELRIRGCHWMVNVIEDEEEKGDGKVVGGGEIRSVIFPKLEEISLYDLPKLVSFCEWKSDVELPSLTNVEVYKCPNMEKFSMGFVAVPNLKIVQIDKEEVGVTKELNWVLHQHYLARPEKVSFDLVIAFNPFFGHKVPLSLCNRLEELTIERYEGSMSLLTLSVAANLVNLKELYIRNCDEMIKVIEDTEQQERILVFPKLVELYLIDLPKLVSFCDSKCEVEFPILTYVGIRKCRNMKNFSLGLIATPNLEAFTTDLTTYVGVGVDVAFNSLKELEIDRNEKPWHDDKISVSLFNGLEKLKFYEYKGGSTSLFPSSAVEILVNLKVLCISGDEILITIIEDDEKVASGGEIFRTVVFPKLEELYLDSLPKLVRFCEWKCDVELPSLKEVEIWDCPNMENFSMGFVAAPNLKFVEIDGHKDIGGTKDLNDTMQQRYLARQQGISFRNRALQIDHNPFCGHDIPSTLFNGLEELTITKCEGSMSLFTLSMAANLVSLRKLSIDNCFEMIKVIEDEEKQERILLFPNLEELHLEHIPKLVSFCDLKCEVELPLLRKVEIQWCFNMENFSMGLVATPKLEAFTSYLTTYVGVGVDVAFNNLKKLEIRENDNPLYYHKISASLFNGLEMLEFYHYKGSMSLFSCSAVENLVNLKVLSMGYFNDIVVNVIEDKEEEEHGKMLSGGEIIRSVVIFPKLEELYLVSLPKLVSFCEWKCDVEFPSLTKLEIRDCRNMESFSVGFVAAPNLKIVQIDKEEIDAAKDLNGVLQQHYLARPEKGSFDLVIAFNPFYDHKVPSSLCNRLKELTINKYVGSMSFFTLFMAANLVSLRELRLENCDEMIKVIEDEQQQERILLFPKLEELYLDELPKLVSFCNSKCEVELPFLRKVYINKCPNMENFSVGLVATPNLEAFTTDLTTYVGVGVKVAFNSLKVLGITENGNLLNDDKISVSLFNGLEKLIFYKCKGSVTLILFSAVGSLVNLQVLGIRKCDEIVKVMEDDEEEKVVSGGEIFRNVVIFPKLEELYLELLPNLVRFCKWKCDVQLPSLAKVDIYECPNMEDFSMGSVDAPNLKIVAIDSEEIVATKDLNGALQQYYLAHQEKENEEEESRQEKDEIEEEEDDD